MAALYELVKNRIDMAMIEGVKFMAQKIQERIDTPYPPASLPGEQPHKRTGNLQGSVTWLLTGDGAKIIVTAPYASELEYGTAKMAPRPFVRLTLIIYEDEMLKVMANAQ